MVENEWKNCRVEGWSGFVIKEKLKILKDKIRSWHENNLGQLDKWIQSKTNEVSFFRWEDGQWSFGGQ